jgi:hypothetical protein
MIADHPGCGFRSNLAARINRTPETRYFSGLSNQTIKNSLVQSLIIGDPATVQHFRAPARSRLLQPLLWSSLDSLADF